MPTHHRESCSFQTFAWSWTAQSFCEWAFSLLKTRFVRYNVLGFELWLCQNKTTSRSKSLLYMYAQYKLNKYMQVKRLTCIYELMKWDNSISLNPWICLINWAVLFYNLGHQLYRSNTKCLNKMATIGQTEFSNTFVERKQCILV